MEEKNQVNNVGNKLSEDQLKIAREKKLLAAILAFFMGSLGVHKFILGYKKEGFIMLGITLGTLFLGSIITGPIAFIEAIIYLTKSDEDFYNTYIKGHKGWF
ncbi:TM2 domain-containing protein [uncultured Apibacter sp.]|uniref:TM2 domain-containing protein n=1 Tax=uncultured Apibacter sp. TaxID=1778616 RepID=UPI0025F778C6|nr:TM2 domain-containing protein [uncultured Apibacter sp.]